MTMMGILDTFSMVALYLVWKPVYATQSAWISHSGNTRRNVNRIVTAASKRGRSRAQDCFPSLRLSKSSDPEDVQRLKETAEQLRLEVSQFEQAKQEQERQEQAIIDQELAERQALRQTYAATVPILKPDGTTVEEQVDFPPYHPKEPTPQSYITVMEADLPLGVILGESDDFPGAVSVDEVAPESNGAQAGLQVGDLIRACTACRMQMEQPAWQLMAGGIGRPKLFRFMYSIDNQVFEETMEAIASNRLDPSGRPVLLVVERKN